MNGGGDPRTRFQGRRVYFPLSEDVSGQSLDLGALVWSARALRDAGGGSYVVAALRRSVRSALAAAARAGGGAIDVEGALAHVWPTVYARDHVMASEVHVGGILPRRLRALNHAGNSDVRALVNAAAADGVAPTAVAVEDVDVGGPPARRGVEDPLSCSRGSSSFISRSHF